MSERVVRNVENDYLMCSICLGRYRDPRLLPCGHSFCKQCLEDHIKQTVSDRCSFYFSCPNDRTQIGRPSPGLAPKDWAAAFPADTFLASLLNAVMIHASSSSSGLDNMACDTHKGRVKEFFCMRCGETACPYCVVKKHKSEKCDCIGIEEAVEQMRPKTEILRNRLQQQMQRARQATRGEYDESNLLKASKYQAMTDLTDLETKLTFFYQTAMKQMQEMKKTIKETGIGQTNDSRQSTMILENISRTIDKFDDVCNHGSGIEVLNTLKKVEEQVKDYDSALNAIQKDTPSLEVNFTVNRTLEKVFENAPVLGSVSVRNADVRQTFNSAMSNTPFLSTPRSQPASARSVTNTSRMPNTARRHSDSTPPRPKLGFCIKSEQQSGSCWQLTGVVILGDYLIVADAHNGQIVKIETRYQSTSYIQLPMECPVCVSDMEDSSDVVVTLPENTELAVVGTDSNLTLKRTIDTSKPYEGIGRLPGPKFVVSCCVVGKQCVDIIDMDGQVFKSIDRDGTGQSLFSWPRFLSVSSPDNILVSDRDQRSLFCFDADGNLKWTHTTSSSPWGVTCHESGSIFLCLENNTVQVISDTGRLIQNNFITPRDGVRVPYAIHARGDYVAITEWGSSLFQPSSPWVYMFSI